MNVLEQRYMEMVPSTLRDLTKAVENLAKEVKELKEQLKTAKSE